MSNNLFGTNFHHHWEGGWWCHFSTSHLKQQEDGCFDTLISSLGQLVVELLTFVFKPLKEGCTSYYAWSVVQSQDVSWSADFFSKQIDNTGVFKMCFKKRKHFSKKDGSTQKRYPILSLLCIFFCFRHQKYRLALAMFLERCKICEVDVKNVTYGWNFYFISLR